MSFIRFDVTRFISFDARHTVFIDTSKCLTCSQRRVWRIHVGVGRNILFRVIFGIVFRVKLLPLFFKIYHQ
jgi:hypothetical protein